MSCFEGFASSGRSDDCRLWVLYRVAGAARVSAIAAKDPGSSSSNQDNFTFTERGSSKTVTIPYGDVIEVKKPGLSKGAKIAVAVGIGVAALALIAIHVRNHLFDDFRLGN